MATLPDPLQLAGKAALPVLNHLLHGQPWLRERLIPFAGRTVQLESVPMTLVLGIDATGVFVTPDPAAAVDAVVRVPPLALARLLAGDEGARQAVDLSGDAALAGAVAGVVQELRWDAEEDLSRVLGDIPARRIVQTARSLASWQRDAALNLLRAVGEFLTEEQPVLAGRGEIAAWARAVDTLRDDAERLEKRILQIAGRMRKTDGLV